MKRTALQLVTELFKRHDATLVTVIEYQVGSNKPYDKENYRALTVPLAELEETVKRKIDAAGYNVEIGISTEFTAKVMGEDVQFWLAAADMKSAIYYSLDLTSKDVFVKSSQNSFHVYTNEARLSNAEAMAVMLQNYGAQCDLDWVALSLLDGFGTLRVSANSDRFKEFGVPVEL